MGTWYQQEINLCFCESFWGLFVIASGPGLAHPDQYSIGKASKDITQTQLPKNYLLASNMSGAATAAGSFIYCQPVFFFFFLIAWSVFQMQENTHEVKAFDDNDHE